MRLVATVEHYAPQIGGAERVVQRLAGGLVARGHDVTVVTSGRRSTDFSAGVRVERFPVRGNLVRGMRGPVDEAMALIRASAPDVVFNYAAQTWTTDACLTFLGTSAPFIQILAPCGFSALNTPTYASYFARLKELLPLYDALVFHSAIYQDWGFAAEAGATQMHVIRNGADEPHPTARRSDRPALCVTVGSHVRTKGHHDFIRAIHSIARTHDVRGAIVAPFRTGVQIPRGCQPRCLLAAARPGGRIELRSGRARHAAEAALSEAELFLFPSSIECAPLAVLEAMAAAVPWISYDVGNVRELPGGVVVYSYDDLVRTAAALLDDPSERSRLGADGHAGWRMNHQWDGIIRAYERLFTQARPAGSLGAL